MKKTFLLFLVQLIFLSFLTLAQTTPRPKTWAQPISNYEFKNLYKLNDTIYRSEQPTEFGLSELCDLKIKSLLNLRLDQADKNLTTDCKFRMFQVKMDPDHFTEADVVNALKAMKTAPKPLLVHCFYGSDRTGLVLAMYRIVYQNWSKTDALNEMTNGGYGFHKSYTNMTDFIKNADITSIRNKLK